MGFCMHIDGVVCDNCRLYRQPHPYYQPYVVPVVQPRLIEGQKCDMCGSTAVDHTEMQCQMNRTLRHLNTVNDLVATNTDANTDVSNPPTPPKRGNND